MQEDKINCGNCRFFIRPVWMDMKPKIPEGVGECKRYPPRIRGTVNTHEKNWCGEFKEK